MLLFGSIVLDLKNNKNARNPKKISFLRFILNRMNKSFESNDFLSFLALIDTFGSLFPHNLIIVKIFQDSDTFLALHRMYLGANAATSLLTS